MLTLEQTLLSQMNLQELCSPKLRQPNEIFLGNATYGMNFIVKQYAGLPLDYPLKVVLPHGLYLQDDVWLEEITAPLPSVLCYPEYLLKVYNKSFQKYGLEKKAILSASPFVYLTELLKEYPHPERKGTIFFPAHSSGLIKSEMDFDLLAEELVSLDDEYQPVTVCVYWLDCLLGRHIPFQKRGLRVVSAGHMTDPLFLFRFYHLCSTHRYSASNALGSHIFYSVKSGCSFFFLDKVKYSLKAETDKFFEVDGLEMPLERETSIKLAFRNPQPVATPEQLKLVNYYLGTEYLKSPEELRQQLFEAEEMYKNITQVNLTLLTPPNSLDFNQQEPEITPSKPLVSVVVIWQSSADILNLWECNLAYLAETQIIFIDNGSDRSTRDALQNFCQRHKLLLLQNEGIGNIASARNLGAKVATGEDIIFLNSNVQILNSPIEILREIASNGIAGPQLLQNDLGNIYTKGWVICIKKSILQELGGWCEDYCLDYWSDIDLGHRAKSNKYSLKAVPCIGILMRELIINDEKQQNNRMKLHHQDRMAFLRKYHSLHPKIVIDGVLFQLDEEEITQVWKSLLEEWSLSEFAKYILVLNRGETAPQIPGIRYRAVLDYNVNNIFADREMLQQICDEEDADLFISTYYTTPISTPSVMMVHEVISEISGLFPEYPAWRGKHHAIQYASAYIAASENTAQDLIRFFPSISPESVTVAHYGVNNIFSPAPSEEVNHFKAKYGIKRPYFLLSNVGNDYKNSILFFTAFSQLGNKESFDIVCVNSKASLNSELRKYTYNTVVHLLQLSDDELRLAYAGAIALVYPSMYEGFGLPILEAIACGCPVITCPNASIPEVAENAALYVKCDDVNGLIKALDEVQKPTIRESLVAAGLEQARKFSWMKMAKLVSSVLIDTTLQHLKLREINLVVFPDWSADEEFVGSDLTPLLLAILSHLDNQRITLLIDKSNTSEDEINLLLSSLMMNLMMEEDLEVSEEPNIVLIGELSALQWEALLPHISARIVLEHENKQAFDQCQKLGSLPVCYPDNLINRAEA